MNNPWEGSPSLQKEYAMMALILTLGAAVNAVGSIVALTQHNWPVLIATIGGAFLLGLLHILLGATP
jgi:hypothetical protein